MPSTPRRWAGIPRTRRSSSRRTPDNVVIDGKFPYPPATQNLHFEIELVVALKSGGVNIKPADAMGHVFGYAVGIDMTRRDLQDVAKKLARPWEVAKAFEASAPCTALVPAHQVESPIARARSGSTSTASGKQTGDLSQMIWDIPNQIAFLSTLFELKAGDLIFTGTPAGVGAIKKGDKLKGHVDGVGDLEVAVVSPLAACRWRMPYFGICFASRALRAGTEPRRPGPFLAARDVRAGVARFVILVVGADGAALLLLSAKPGIRNLRR